MEHVQHDSEIDVEAVENVHLAQLAGGDRMSVQRYRFEPGSSVPLHSHPHEQSGYLFRGTLTFLLDDGSEILVEAGGSYVLAGGEAHGVENRGDEPAIGVDIFSPPRLDPDWAE